MTQDTYGNKTQRTTAYDVSNSVGIWYHLAGTYNKTTGELKLFINGQLVDTRRHPKGNIIVPLIFYPDMKIGNSVPNGYFNGNIVDVRPYNRVISEMKPNGFFNAMRHETKQIHGEDGPPSAPFVKVDL